MTNTAQSRPASPHNNHAKGAEKLRAHLAMMLFAALIAGSFSLGGIATQYADPTAIQALRYFFNMCLLGGLYLIFVRKPIRLPPQPARYLAFGGLMGIYMLTMFIALEFTNPVSTGAVFTLMPLISAGFALVLLRQRTRSGVLLSLVIAAIGSVWVIFRGDVDALLRFDVGRGEMIYFIGVLCHAMYVPVIRLLDRKDHPLLFGFWQSVVIFLMLFAIAAPELWEIDYASLPAIVWITIAYLTIATTALTVFLLQYASMRLPAPKVLAYGYLTPSYIIVYEGLLGHGWAAAPIFLGALVTAGGLVVMALLPD